MLLKLVLSVRNLTPSAPNASEGVALASIDRLDAGGGQALVKQAMSTLASRVRPCFQMLFTHKAVQE